MDAGPFRGSEARALRLVERGELYGPRFVRLFPDVFVSSTLTPDLGVRSHAAYLLVRDLGGALAGYSAAHLLGAACAPRNAPAEVLAPRYVRPHPGLLTRFGTAAEADLVEVGGVRVTAALRTAWDLARRLPLVDAVVAVDALARRGGFTASELLLRREKEPGARGCRALDAVVALVDPRAESAMESRLRVELILAGLPVPEPQYLITDGHGHPLARVDLAYAEARLAIEYDGSTHFTREQTERDRRRDALLARFGWETLRVSKDDVALGFQRIARQVRDVLAIRSGRALPAPPSSTSFIRSP